MFEMSMFTSSGMLKGGLAGVHCSGGKAGSLGNPGHKGHLRKSRVPKIRILGVEDSMSFELPPLELG